MFEVQYEQYPRPTNITLSLKREVKEVGGFTSPEQNTDLNTLKMW
jgi:hypothetical protein